MDDFKGGGEEEARRFAEERDQKKTARISEICEELSCNEAAAEYLYSLETKLEQYARRVVQVERRMPKKKRR